MPPSPAAAAATPAAPYPAQITLKHFSIELRVVE
jgi:hypothetical protein